MDYSFFENFTSAVHYSYFNDDVENPFMNKTVISCLNILAIMCILVSVFGVVSNAINMAVFSKIGFKDSINMSLFALAISDLGSCFFMIPGAMGIFSWMNDLGLPVIWVHLGHVIGAWPHIACAKITTLITAFITFERCLCVFMPLKVKTIITRKITKYFLVFAFFIVGAAMALIFYSNQIGWSFVAETNQTILGLVFPKEREDIEIIVLPFMNAVISQCSFIFIVISTVVLVVTLRKQSTWRAKATGMITTETSTGNNGGDKDINRTKEKSISRMVVIISTLFIASFFPSVVLFLLLWSDRRFDLGGPLNYIFVIMVAMSYTLETVNAAMNIVIYYRNSSNYRVVFDQIFRSFKKTRY